MTLVRRIRRARASRYPQTTNGRQVGTLVAASAVAIRATPPEVGQTRYNTARISHFRRSAQAVISIILLPPDTVGVPLALLLLVTVRGGRLPREKTSTALRITVSPISIT